MDSDDNHHQQQQQQLGSYGLLRFRSAPSSLPLSDEIHTTSRFVNYGSPATTTVKESPVGSPRGYAALPPHYPRPTSGMGSSSAAIMDGSYYYYRTTAAAAALVSPNQMAAEHHHPKSSLSSSLLMRQSSSPPGLFSHLPSHNGYNNTMRGGTENTNYRGGSGLNGEISSPPCSNRLKGHTSLFSSGQLPSSSSSSLGILSHMSDLGTDSSSRFPAPGFPFNSWSDSSHFSDNNFVGLKREEENHHDFKMFNTSLNGEMVNRHPMISHRTMSLPRTSSDMVAMEKFLQLQDSVPCKIRAKRGCATHPRSIAERVRRTRISERMRKLQELVPNMDKQTNTADMLDLAVDYIKDLQNEFKTLNESRANCKCMSMQKQ